VSPSTTFQMTPESKPASVELAVHRWLETWCCQGQLGVIVRALDADDLFTSGALRRDIEVLTAHPEIGWCVSPVAGPAPDRAAPEPTNARKRGTAGISLEP
jgi:hypothetical protein